jgi:hypothetical protein
MRLGASILGAILTLLICAIPHAAEIDQSTTNGLFYIRSSSSENRVLFRRAQTLEYIDAQPVGLTEHTYRVIGGVLIRGEIDASVLTRGLQQDASLAIQSFSYYLDRSDGNRFIIQTTSGEFSVALPDWFLLPLLDFVDSGHHAAVTLFGPAANNLSTPDQRRLRIEAMRICRCPRLRGQTGDQGIPSRPRA